MSTEFIYGIRKETFVLKIFFGFLLFTSMTFAQSVQPGLWQTDSSVEVNGLSLPASKEEECISAAEAKDLKKSLTKELAKNGCSSKKWTVKGKQIDVLLKCEKSDLEAEGKLHGTVNSKNYDLKGEAEGSYKSIPSNAKFSLKGKWLKSCP